MTLARARADYAACARAISRSQDAHLAGRMALPPETCPVCHGLGLEIEAASIRLDLMTAEASLERIRGSVAW